MEIVIKGNPKEIAALVVAIQERQEKSGKVVGIMIDGKPVGVKSKLDIFALSEW